MRGSRRPLPRARPEGEGVRGVGAGFPGGRGPGGTASGPWDGGDRPVKISARDRLRAGSAKTGDGKAAAFCAARCLIPPGRGGGTATRSGGGGGARRQ